MGLLSGYSASASLAQGASPGREPTVEERAARAGISTEPAKDEPSGLFGFLGNVVGDVKEIGTGLTSLISAAGSDLWDASREAITGGAIETDGYNLAEMGRQLPSALAADYSRRYGGEGFDAVKEELYENPLSYLGDALSVATLGGYGAARGAQMASKLPSVRTGLAALAEGSDNVGLAARAVDTVLPGLKNGPGAAPAGMRNVVNPETLRVQEVAREFNPMRRVWSENITQRVLTKPSERLSREVAELEAQVAAQGGPELAPRALVNSLDKRRKALEMTEAAATPYAEGRALRSRLATRNVSKITDRLIGHHGWGHIQDRDRMRKEFADVLSRAPDMDPDDLAAKLQIDLQQTPVGRMSFDAVRSMTPVTNKQTELLTAIQDDLARIQMMEAGQYPPSLIKQARADLLDEIKAMAPPDTKPSELRALVDEALPLRLAELLPYELHSAYRYVEWLSEGAAADAAGFADDLASVHDDLRLVVHKNLTGAYLESGGTYRSVFERALKPMNKVVADKWDFDTPEEAFALDDLLREQGHKAPLYVPHIETLNLKVSDFLMPWRMSGQRRAAQAGRKGFKRSEGEVFDRWLQGVADAAVKNPLDAYARRASEIARHKESIRFLENLVTEVGREVTHLDDLAEGEVVLNLDGAKLLIRKRIEVGDALADEAMDMAGVTGQVQTAAQAALAKLPDEVMENFARPGVMYAVPKAVAERVDELMKYRLGYNARLFFDTPMNAWRNMTLYLRPAFYLNNFFGNTSFLKLQGGSLGSVVRQAVDPKYRKKIQEVLDAHGVREAVESTGFHDAPSQRATHFGRFQDRMGAQALTAVKGSAPGRAAGKLREKLQAFNQHIEDAFRRESYMTAVQKDLSLRNVQGVGRPLFKTYAAMDRMLAKGASEADISRWLDDMNKTMNDYSALTPFERNVLRRGFIPFWPFYKHAARTLFRMPIDHPVKATVIERFGEISREMSAEQLGEEPPPWLEGMFTVGGTDPSGETSVFAPQSMNPLSDVAFPTVGGGPFKHFAEQLGPIPKMLIEQATGTNIFTGKEFTDPDVFSGFGRDRQFEYDPATGEFEYMHEGGPRPPVWSHLLGQIPLVSDLMQFAAGGAAYSAQPWEAYPSAENPDEPLYPNDYGLEALKWMGLPQYHFNPDEHAQGMEEDRMAAISTYLNRMGL